MTRLFVAIVLLLSFYNSLSQQYLCLARQEGAKNWGYIDQTGTFVIQPRAGKCMEFSSDGLAVVLPPGSKQYSFIKSDGTPLATEVSNFKLMEIFGFGVKGYSNGMVAIKVGEKWGFLNADGKLAVQPKFEDVTEFYEGYASGKIGNKFFVITKDGSEKPVELDQTKDVKHFSDGLAPYYTVDKRAGFIDINGSIAIPAKFLTVGYFSGGLAWAKTSDGKIGYINKSGAWAVNPQFDAAKEFDPTSQMALVRNEKVWNYINSKGEKLNMSLEGYGDFVEGLCWGKQGVKVGFFDKSGNWVIAPQFDAVRDFKNGYAAARQGELWGIIDKKGQWVVKPDFNGIRDMEKVK